MHDLSCALALAFAPAEAECVKEELETEEVEKESPEEAPNAIDSSNAGSGKGTMKPKRILSRREPLISTSQVTYIVLDALECTM